MVEVGWFDHEISRFVNFSNEDLDPQYLFLGVDVPTSQCAPGSFNLNQKVHGLYHFYKAVIYKTIQNQLKKPSVIRLPKQ